MTYHYEPLKEEAECVKCDAPATILLVADYCDDVGYIDEIPLCEECVRKRN